MVAKDHKARRPKFHSVLWLCNPQRTKPPEGGCQRYYAPSPPPLSTLVIVVRPPHRVLRFYSCSFLRLQRGTVTGTVTGTGPRFHKSQPQESVCYARISSPQPGAAPRFCLFADDAKFRGIISEI